jgi:glycosyltransferase involved in cell wall biosynthesis
MEATGTQPKQDGKAVPSRKTKTGWELPVSVIVPVYNVRNYLDRCVGSVLGQTFRDFELVLVDDGSTDGSGEMCDAWAGKDGRVHVLHQANAGQGAARNVAVRQSSGEWLAFVDSDDFVAPDYLGYLLSLARDCNAGISTCQCVLTDGRPLAGGGSDAVDVFGRTEACLRLLRGEGLMDGPWCKLFRRELLEACPFPEGRVYEDTAIMGRLVYASGRLARGGRVLYNYFVNPHGTTHSMDLQKRRDQLWANREIALFFREAGEREAEALAWDKLRKVILADVKKRVLPTGELRKFWRENRRCLPAWDALGAKCRAALAVPGLYRLWSRLAGKGGEGGRGPHSP